MKIYNAKWTQFFPRLDLKSGWEYACGGKVLNLNQDDKAIKATVKGSKNYKVTFAIHNNNEINKMNCTCPSFESKRYCKLSIPSSSNTTPSKRIASVVYR